MILLVASKKDVASINIAQQILDHYVFDEDFEVFQGNPVHLKNFNGKNFKLIFVNEDSLYNQSITDFFNPELIIFLSRHSSSSGIPTLSVHTPGNLGNAELGGIPRKVSVAAACIMKEALLEMTNLSEKKELDFQVSYECTHHGPSLDVPAMFIEVGGSPEQWKDLEAAEVVAHAVMVAASTKTKYRAVLGIGGPHYNAKFTDVAMSTQTAFGHIIPKYMISTLDAEMTKQCVEKTMEEVKTVILEWKGIKSVDKERIITILRDICLPIEKV
jgi:D-aminoacyl-tRNA deacylase